MKIGTTLEIDTTEKLDIGQHQMTLYEVARWMSLIRGIETINKTANRLKIDLDKNKTWVKPLALQRYVEEDTPASVTEVKLLLEKEQEKCTIG
tara:strand:- start:77 stop:355 length:279 start_codon:yes stop_codon:yes gene_type:complete